MSHIVDISHWCYPYSGQIWRWAWVCRDPPRLTGGPGSQIHENNMNELTHKYILFKVSVFMFRFWFCHSYYNTYFRFVILVGFISCGSFNLKGWHNKIQVCVWISYKNLRPIQIFTDLDILYPSLVHLRCTACNDQINLIPVRVKTCFLKCKVNSDKAFLIFYSWKPLYASYSKNISGNDFLEWITFNKLNPVLIWNSDSNKSWITYLKL